MPWIPELFSSPVLERFRHEAEVHALAAGPVPYFAGVTSGETDALVGSFAGEPELHHPIRGRVKGRRAFERFVTDTNAWLTASNAVVGRVERIITPRRGIAHLLRHVAADRQTQEPPAGAAARPGPPGAGRPRRYELFFSNGGGIPLEQHRQARQRPHIRRRRPLGSEQ
jgi:hypothetical protein